MDINRVGNNDNVRMNRLLQNQKKNEVKNEKKANQNRKNSESVKLNGSSKKYIEMAKDIPEVREKVVQDMKTAIEKGVYQIDSNKIAEKIFGG